MAYGGGVIGGHQNPTKIIASFIYVNKIVKYFGTLSFALYTSFSATKLDFVIQALLLDYVLALVKNTRTPRVHLVFI